MESTLKRLAGRVALVTGGSRGIGYAIAERLLAEGARVCLTARKEQPLTEAARTLGDATQVLAVAGRTDDPEHRQDALTRTLERFGRLDALVNNAATNLHFGPLVQADPAAIRKTFEVNLFSVIGWIQAAHHAWLSEHGGSVLNVASTGAFNNPARSGVYNVTKAALVHLTRQLAVELGPGIRVNALAPAVVETAFSAAVVADRGQELADEYPLARLGTPTDIAGAAAFLLGDEASWITGTTLVVDGGVLAAGRLGA